MASHDAKDSLDVLQDMFNDVLIHTGKALRASRNSSGNTNPGQAPVQFKLPETMRTFHSALDDLENEIVRAKSVMQRDLGRLQANKTLSARPQPVESQSKSPMVIDLDSSPPKGNVEGPTANQGAETKPVAPFPDMGMDISAAVPLDQGSATTSQTPQAATQGDAKTEAQSSTPTVPAPSADQAGSGSKPADTTPAEPGNEAPNSELAFTDMEFTLAPPENGGQADLGTQDQDQAFDLTNFTSAEMGNDSIPLDNLLPQGSTGQSNGDPLAAPDMNTENQDQADDGGGGGELNEPAFDALNMDTMDFGAADGTDFDFSMDDGNSFNDLMNSHEQNFDTSMEHGQFDADFFGLDKPDGT